MILVLRQQRNGVGVAGLGAGRDELYPLDAVGGYFRVEWPMIRELNLTARFHWGARFTTRTCLACWPKAQR
jgi:hypothetical protein